MCIRDSPDGGLDADEDILINGGYVVAVGIRNDPISDDSAQQYIQLTFASVLPAGSQIALTDDSGDQLLSFTLEKSAQSIVFSSPDLKQDVDYTLTVDGVTHPLPVPFAVIATQSPVGSAGTQLLPQAQLDRFMAVSYTHLDVYKRQLVMVLSLAACAGNGDSKDDSTKDSASDLSLIHILSGKSAGTADPSAAGRGCHRYLVLQH